jgi:hypothetical protein
MMSEADRATRPFATFVDLMDVLLAIAFAGRWLRCATP